jgi:hypothetical protein
MGTNFVCDEYFTNIFFLLQPFSNRLICTYVHNFSNQSNCTYIAYNSWQLGMYRFTEYFMNNSLTPIYISDLAIFGPMADLYFPAFYRVGPAYEKVWHCWMKKVVNKRFLSLCQHLNFSHGRSCCKKPWILDRVLTKWNNAIPTREENQRPVFKNISLPPDFNFAP